MYCAHCGAQVVAGQSFCSKCGQPLVVAGAAPSTGAPAPPQSSPGQSTGPAVGFPPTSRVAKHLNLLGVLWIIFSVFRLIPGVAMLVFGSLRFPFMFLPVPEPFRAFIAPFLGAIGVLLSGFAIAGIAAGWGLMAHCSWARMLAIVLACISLVHMPFGTALGIYTLWVLLPQGADREYQRLAGAN